MKGSGHLSPIKLAVWSAGSSLFFASYFLLAFAVPHHDHQPLASALHGKPWLMVLLLTPLVCALGITPWAWTRLQKGVKQNAWTEAELAPLRRWLDRPVWMWLYLALFGVSIALFAWQGRGAVFLLFVLFPLQTVMSLQRIVKPPTDSSELMNLGTSAPIRSEHWGHTG